MNMRKERLKVYDMTCTSCEKRVETAITKLNGVSFAKASYSGQHVDVEYDSEVCSVDEIKSAVRGAGYKTEKSMNYGLVGIAVIGIIIIMLGNSTDGFDMNEKLRNASYMVLFMVGLLTSIHCVGMCGGIMLSQSITENTTGKFKAMKPALLYNLGRVLSYTILGGIVGAIGSVLPVSLGFQAGLQLVAGLFMVIMGLNMAGFSFFRKLSIRLPWSSCSAKNSSRTPFTVGILNGLMPCGPLQTMQLYALGTGSATAGATSMFIFALGTVPLMMGFGALSGFLSKSYTKSILKFSGVLVVVLGLIMSTRGLALFGINVSGIALPNTQKAATSKPAADIPKPEIKDGVQIIRMTADRSGYNPKVLYVQKDMPVKWIIDGKQLTSCNNAIVVPSLNIQKKLVSGENIVEFTPKGGDINYSCWMGMIKATIKVVDNIETADSSKVTAANSSAANEIPQSGSGSCCGDGDASASSNQQSIYGNDLSKTPIEKLVRRAAVSSTGQSLAFKGIGFEFDPLIIVVNKGVKTSMEFDLTNFDNPEGEYIIIPANSNSTSTTFNGKKGVVKTEYTFTQNGGYGIIKGSYVLGVIEVVDDVKKADLEAIRDKYLNTSSGQGSGACH